MVGSVAPGRRALAFARALNERDERTPAGAPAAGQAPGDTHPGNDHSDPPEAPAPHESPADDSTGEASPEERLTGLAAQLASLPRPVLTPEVKEVQRAQLIAAMEQEQARQPAVDEQLPVQRRGAHRASQAGHPGMSRLTRGLTAGGVGFGVAATAFGGVSAASNNALPGDSLYGMKRGMEEFKLDLTGDDAERGRVYLDHASTRLKEARRLMEAGRGGGLDQESLATVRRTLTAMSHDAGEGRRLLSSAYEQGGALEPMQSLSSFSEQHRTGWSRLKERLPAELRDVTGEITSVFEAMDSDIAPVRGLLRQTLSPQAPAQPGPGEESQEQEGRPVPSHPAQETDPPAEENSTPSPSGSGQDNGDHEGLLGGVLDPPPAPEDSPDERDSGTPERTGEPDVTLPPLLPEILPDLGGLSGGSGR